MAGSIAKRADGAWQARFRPVAGGSQKYRTFPRRVDAQRWLDETTASIVTGQYIDPKTAKTTVEQWCEEWIKGYATRRASTVRQARVHIAQINRAFGPMPLATIRPSQVKAWTSKLKAEGYAASTVYAIYRRLAQIMGDAAHDGIIAKSPCSRRTSPGGGVQRPYVATTEQVWALHDAMPEHLRSAILLGAFVGLRTAETCGLRVADVDFMRGVVSPVVQWPADPLKSETSRTPVPIPQDLALMLSASLVRGAETVLCDEVGQQCPPWAIERAVRAARVTIDGLPEGFRFHDLRHYFASLLIASGLDVKVVQKRLRHASAMTTLNTYGHMWPDSDESSRAAVSAVLMARPDVEGLAAR